MNDPEMPLLLELIITFFLIAGAIVALIGSIGLARLKDFYMRLHGPTKATTLGVGALLIASVIHFSTRGDGVSLHEVLVTVFLFITAPVSAHLLAKTALHLRVGSLAQTPPQAEAASVAEADASD
jgi:multicomponent K+:H+ antiporter subunit G